MDLQQLAYLSQIVSGLAVLVSLTFVGFQLRQNNRARRAAAEQHIMSSWLTIGQLLSANAAAYAQGVSAQSADLTDLPPPERMQFLAMNFAMFKHLENIFLHVEAGDLQMEVWEPFSAFLQIQYHQRGVKHWWSLRKFAFAPSFRRFVEALPEPDAPSTQSVLDRPVGG